MSETESVVCFAGAGWGASDCAEAPRPAVWSGSGSASESRGASWGGAGLARSGSPAPWLGAGAASSRSRAQWLGAAWRAAVGLAVWPGAGAASAGAPAPWVGAAPVDSRVAFDWPSGPGVGDSFPAPWFGAGQAHVARQIVFVGQSSGAATGEAWWPGAGVPAQGPTPPKEIKPKETFEACAKPDPLALIFALENPKTPDPTALYFLLKCGDVAASGDGPAPGESGEALKVVNEIKFETADGRLFDALTFSASSSIESNCWTFRVGLGEEAAFMVSDYMASPKRPIVYATVNGIRFGILCESVSRSLMFGRREYELSGRSPICLLGTDYSPRLAPVSFPASARAVCGNMSDGDFVVDASGMTDYRIDEGAPDFSGMSPLAAITAISEAAGAAIVPDCLGFSVRILHPWGVRAWELKKYPKPSSLPSSVAKSASATFSTSPGIDSVLLTGPRFCASVTRQGFAGSRRAGDATNPLFSEASCCREYGAKIMSESGRHAFWSIVAPIDADGGSPFFSLCEIVKYTPHDGSPALTGVVRSLSVEAAPDGDAVAVWQTVELDCYEGWPDGSDY